MAKGDGKPIIITTTPKGQRPSTATKKGGGNKPKDDRKGSNKKKDPAAQARADAKAAEARAVKREKEQRAKAGKRFLESAENLSLQAKALRQAINTEFAGARDNNLADIDRALSDEFKLLSGIADMKGAELRKAGADTEKAAGSVAEMGFANLVRERQETLTNVLEQGAGETDSVRAMLMSARNWYANTSENNRTYFDTMRSVNTEITDLNASTQTSLATAARTAEGQKEMAWQDYYNRRAESLTQLGNVLGQQADFYAQAKEMGVKPPKGAEKEAEKAMKDAFNNAALESGKSYTQQGLPEWISNYRGMDKLQAKQSNTELSAAVQFEKLAKAEGATLRKWEAA